MSDNDQSVKKEDATTIYNEDYYTGYTHGYEDAATDLPRSLTYTYKMLELTPTTRWVWVACIRSGLHSWDEDRFPTHAQALQWILEQLKEREA